MGRWIGINVKIKKYRINMYFDFCWKIVEKLENLDRLKKFGQMAVKSDENL